MSLPTTTDCCARRRLIRWRHCGQNEPVPHLVIGVAGGSGSGKTTVVRRIVDALGDARVTVLEHDRYYRDRNDLRLEERA